MPTVPSAERLDRYWAKRDFDKTPEPRGVRQHTGRALSFVIQKHDASRLHYDFRLEFDGVLLSWAVPKGPSLDPKDKRLAVRTEDHPLSYATFEGNIPAGQYGAGDVIVWDRGTWTPAADPKKGLAAGKLVFELQGEKLAGLWELVRIQKPGERQEAWLLFKKRDDHARDHAEHDVVSARPDSVISGQGLPERAAAPARTKAKAATATKGPAARQRADAARPDGAVKAPLPRTLAPQLATLSASLPTAGAWAFEVKYDGYRVMARIERGVPAFITRGGHDWTDRLPVLAKAVKALGIASGWLDGELVVLNDQGVPDFNALQKSFDQSRTSKIVYFVFDAPFLDGLDLRASPLQERRRVLKERLATRENDHVRFSPDIEADAASILKSACAMQLEGVIAKRLDAPYEGRRTMTWLKLKCQQRQEFVVAGFTPRSNDARAIGSLLLGVHDEHGALVPVGSVGTGWDTATARDLYKTLSALEVPDAPFAGPPKKAGRWSRRGAGTERWVRPTRVAEVSFAEWTPDAQIRHAVFVSLRTDKPAKAITREAAVQPAPAPSPPTGTHAMKLSNPDRVIDPQSGVTKLGLARYYESVAEWILPHLKGRPCSLVRGPSGIEGELFFQKHADKMHIPGIKELDADLWPKHAPLLEVNTVAALAGASQMNVIEFHTWNAKSRTIGKPDRIVFDLDPGEGVAWNLVQEGAALTRALLTELGLQAWLKTSGGKGLHVVVPIAARFDWDTVKSFSQAVVQHLAHYIPERFVAKSGPSNRVGKVFVDYLRNGHGATTAAAFSARARPGLGVSMPVHWDDLASLKSGSQWTVANARDHLSFRHDDPWADYWTTKQSLGPALKRMAPPA